MAQVANRDIVVVLPGILGSTLERGGHQTWGYRQIVRHLVGLVRRLTDDLSLPAEAYDDPERGHQDGTLVTGVLETVGIIPGFLSIDGYDRLLAFLAKAFAESADDILAFPYDWRQSNRVSAHRLSERVEPIIAARRRTDPDARLVLIGHSMGGLVARYYAECLDPNRHTRRVITIGTPYRGAIKALEIVANGYVRAGPVKLALGELARSLPSVAELLPMYDCVGSDERSLSTLRAHPVTSLPRAVLEHGVDFHDEIAAAVAASDSRPKYHALVGHLQPTDVWATLSPDGVVLPVRPSDMGDRGDGTVPLASATPPEWDDPAEASFYAGKHASLQQVREVAHQLHGVLVARPKRGGTVGEELGVSADDHVLPGDPWVVEAEAASGLDRLQLRVEVKDNGLDGGATIEAPLVAVGQGRYRAEVRVPQAGVYTWTVDSGDPSTAVGAVSDVVLCADVGP